MLTIVVVVVIIIIIITIIIIIIIVFVLDAEVVVVDIFTGSVTVRCPGAPLTYFNDGIRVIFLGL